MSEVLDYARRISYTTFAPAGYVPGAPLCGIMPPAPQEEHFQASRLAAFNAERRAKEKAASAAAEARQKEEARLRMVEAAAAIPPEELIERLSKWKPGEPWPDGIPPPPPGWKPGDALHFELPKREDAGVGALVKPTNAVAAAKAAPRVVPFVSLDLNPDLDDDDVASISDDFEGKLDGPRVAVFEVNGFDTHAAQGGVDGSHTKCLVEMDEIINNLKDNFQVAYKDTIILTVTEFGRTISQNGGNGTEHCYGTAIFMSSGLLKRSQVHTDWPGL